MKFGSEILKVKRIDEPSIEQIQSYIQWHLLKVPRYNMLMNYYEGNHNILNRKIYDDSLAHNNKVKANYCSLITDGLSGYFISYPIKYTSDDTKTVDIINYINKINDTENLDYELAKQCSIFGHTFEVAYHDYVPNLRFGISDPRNTFMLYDIESFEETPFACIRYIKDRDKIQDEDYYIVEYMNEVIIKKYYIYPNKGELNNSTESSLHLFNMLPCTEYKNNNERIGDFETIIELQDALNLITSDRVNNIENMVNALLILKGYSLDDEKDENGNHTYTQQRKQMVNSLKKAGILLLDDDGDAKFISNTLDGTTAEVLSKTIVQHLYSVSCCPNMTDDSFGGTISGVAMRYKLYNTEQKASVKEKKFTSAIYNRLRLMDASPKVDIVNWVRINLIFTRNIPENEVEKIDSFVKLKGIISDKTLFELLSFLGISDPESEIKRLEEENNRNTEIYLGE